MNLKLAFLERSAFFARATAPSPARSLSASIKSAQSNPKVSETEQNGSKMWPKAHLLYEQYEEMAEQSDRIPAGSIVMHGSYSNDKVGFFVRHFSRKVLACFLPIRRSLLLTLYHFSPLVAQMFAGRVSGAGAHEQSGFVCGVYSFIDRLLVSTGRGGSRGEQDDWQEGDAESEAESEAESNPESEAVKMQR